MLDGSVRTVGRCVFEFIALIYNTHEQEKDEY